MKCDDVTSGPAEGHLQSVNGVSTNFNEIVRFSRLGAADEYNQR
jgi:hypothetical protein